MARPRIGDKVQTTVPCNIKKWAQKQAGVSGVREADIIRDLVLAGFESLSPARAEA